MKPPDSFIFRTVVRLSFFIINILAIYLLLRGHNLPGGGFIGGLASAISLVLLSLGLGLQEIRRIIPVDVGRVAAAGLLISTLTGAIPILFGQPFLHHYQFHFTPLPQLGEWHVGTPLLFDIGVYLVVVGITCKLVFSFGRSTERLQAMPPNEAARYSAPIEIPIEEEITPDDPDPGLPGKELGNAS